MVIVMIRDGAGVEVRSGSSGGEHYYLLGEDLRLQVLEGQFEAPVILIAEHLDSHQVVWGQGLGWGQGRGHGDGEECGWRGG